MKNKPLHILFDINPLVNSQKSGVGYYTEHLLTALASRYPTELKITALYSNFLRRKQVEFPEFPNITYRCNSILPSKLINILRRTGIELPVELFYPQRLDFIIYPNFVGYRSLRKTPSAVAIHDLGYLDCPEYLLPGNRSFLERFVPKSIRRSNFIITISEATKAAIQKHYGTDSDKFVITPIPPAKSSAVPSKPKNCPENFILFISTLEPRKNFIGLVRGYMELPEKLRKKYGLVLAGGTGWDVDQDISEIKQLQEKGENIVLTGYISQPEKNWLLQNAAVFVLPSHYEGFGMPILEAMEVGTPTAVSDIPVFHEVSGNATLYFNHKDPASIATTIQQIIENEELRAKLINKGHQQVSKLDWDSIAEDVYNRMVSEAKHK